MATSCFVASSALELRRRIFSRSQTNESTALANYLNSSSDASPEDCGTLSVPSIYLKPPTPVPLPLRPTPLSSQEMLQKTDYFKHEAGRGLMERWW